MPNLRCYEIGQRRATLCFCSTYNYSWNFSVWSRAGNPRPPRGGRLVLRIQTSVPPRIREGCALAYHHFGVISVPARTALAA